jgi:VanZ family protein
MATNPQQKLETPEPHSVRALAAAWLPLALWVGLIQSFAGDGFSEDSTSRFIGPLLHWLFPEADPETRDLLHFLIRKSCHVIEYGILALLSWRALARPIALRCKRRALWSLALVLAVATLDESRQATSELRGGAVSDVALDLAGGLLALFGARWISQQQIFQRLRVMLRP